MNYEGAFDGYPNIETQDTEVDFLNVGGYQKNRKMPNLSFRT